MISMFGPITAVRGLAGVVVTGAIPVAGTGVVVVLFFRSSHIEDGQ
jgi:hypothetical protein